jgi:hypothetical protein
MRMYKPGVTIRLFTAAMVSWEPNSSTRTVEVKNVAIVSVEMMATER